MSSSGLMYAAIVAAWAVYLVPMWLRREDELNRARQTRRYAAAIKVLAHKDAFERRWAHPDEAADAAQLPLAAGQGPVAPPTRKDAAGPANAKPKPKPTSTAATTARPGTESRTGAARADRTVAAKTPAKKGTQPRKNAVAAASAKLGPVVSAPINSAWTAQDEAEPTLVLEFEAEAEEAASPTSAHQQANRQPFAVKTPLAAPAPTVAAATATGAAQRTAPRTGLMVRRRRMVTLLFAVSTIGALISADLGTAYIWAMIAPAALLSAYIVWLRRDERIRAAERARRTAARAAARRAQELEQAQKQAKADREATKARAEAQAQAEEQARAEAEAESLQRQAARRRAAAARSRAQAYSPKPPTAQPHPAAADHPPTRRAANE